MAQRVIIDGIEVVLTPRTSTERVAALRLLHQAPAGGLAAAVGPKSPRSTLASCASLGWKETLAYAVARQLGLPVYRSRARWTQRPSIWQVSRPQPPAPCTVSAEDVLLRPTRRILPPQQQRP
jgi:hypothetical protein